MRDSEFVRRGGLWVLAQFILIPVLAAVVLFARRSGWERAWSAPFAVLGQGAGLLLTLSAVGLLAAAVAHLGSNLTPFPRPLDSSALVDTGAYGIVRHPIYTAIILALFGLALFVNSLLGLVLGALVFIFFNRKASYEERFLEQRYPRYADYRKRVRKLIPFIY
jgi:protein-S-isoprenylcysteine O-methyltransferase Ste14